MVKLIYFIFIIITLPLLIAQAGELNKQESAYFNFIDLNNDKFITFEELNKSLQLIFQLVDENLDGKLSQQEIEELKRIIETLS